MIADVAVVMWKEWRALPGGGSRGQLVWVVISLGIGAVYLPWDVGRAWAEDFMPVLALALALPAVVVGILVPDAFAGERERHTLTTLLASRLPDRAILFGKLGFAMAAGLVFTLVVLSVSLVVANVRAGEVFLYRSDVFLGSLALAVALSGLTATLGVFISLRARTAQAAQRLLIGVMVTLPLTIAFALQAFGAMPFGAFDLLRQYEPWAIVLALAAAVAVVDLALVMATIRAFRRGRLI